MAQDHKSKVVIIGAGVFGLSTAWYLLKRGYTDVTVLERSTVVPARDGAGYDLNKIVRSAYSVPFYTNLAREAIKLWKDGNEEMGLKGVYHESGVFLRRDEQNIAYADNAYQNDLASGARLQQINGPEDLQNILPGRPPAGSVNSGDNMKGYFNLDGGWAESGRGLEVLLESVKKLGARVEGGKEVAGLLRDETGKTSGVKCADSSSFPADVVVLAAGAWSPALAERAGVQGMTTKCTATGQTVVWFELTPEEAERYKHAPVVWNFSTGVYIFPPNAENLVKMAIHANGYLVASSETSTTSSPRTEATHGADGLRIPKEAVQRLRAELRDVYPELGDKPFKGTRLCWYNDTPDDDWIIGYHPSDSGLLLATGDSGHAYKFLPNIGRIIADALEHKLEPEVAKRLAFDRDVNLCPVIRVGPPARNLVLEELCEAQDLVA